MSDADPDASDVTPQPDKPSGRPADRQMDRVFLRRSGYRQRRLRDALMMLPIAGAVLWFIPVLWTGAKTGGVGNGTALIYIFVVWVLLILAVFTLSRFVRLDDDDPEVEQGISDRSADQPSGADAP